MGKKILKGFIVTMLLLTISLGFGIFKSKASPQDGEEIFKAKKCGECHLTVGPAKGKTIEERLKKKGPDLWFAGSKFKQEWLEEWLKNPETIRGVKWGGIEIGNSEHMSLSEQEAKQVTEYLMTLTDEYIEQGVIKETKRMPISKAREAKKWFEQKQACYACHKVKSGKGKVVGGFTGPSLTEAGKRLKGDWIYSFLKNPQVYEPVGRMPVYGDQAFNNLQDKDLKLLAEYLTSFK